MVIAPGFHLLPFRTEKLSPVAPMVLSTRRESRSPPFFNKRLLSEQSSDGSLFFVFEAEAYGFTFLSGEAGLKRIGIICCIVVFD